MVKKSRILAVLIGLVSLWIVLTASAAAVWLTDEVRVIGMVILPAILVGALLVLYFDWRTAMLRRILAGRDETGGPEQSDELEEAA
jgi:hypothetical protein